MTRHPDSSAFIKYLNSTISDLITPIEEIAETKWKKGNFIRDAREMIKSELRQIGTHFAYEMTINNQANRIVSLPHVDDEILSSIEETDIPGMADLQSVR